MSEEVDDEHFIKVRVDHYNEMRSAADLGFEVLVARRNALTEVAQKLPQYPERDSRSMKQQKHGVLDGIPLDNGDVADLARTYDERIKRLAEALNVNLHKPRYK